MEHLEGEVFKKIEIKNFENYLVSNMGRVMINGKLRKQQKTHNGYYRVGLFDGEKYKNFFVHRLVAYTFIGIPKNDKYQIDHINGIKTDNRLENLEWVTQLENVNRAIKNGLIDLNRVKAHSKKANELSLDKTRKKVQLKNVVTKEFLVFSSATEAAEKLNLTLSGLTSAARGERKTHKGYEVKYI